MKVIRDFENRRIRLTPERLAHILEHPEMAGMSDSIANVIAVPERVVQSISDSGARLYYRYFFDTAMGGKYLCVVVKIHDHDAFVLTAYLTDRIKKGVPIWPRKL